MVGPECASFAQVIQSKTITGRQIEAARMGCIRSACSE